MAIAFDSGSGTNGVAVSSLTVAHTCTGSNRILWTGVFTLDDIVTGVTYNGASMTQALKLNYTSTLWVYLYYLVAPDTGTNNVVASFSVGSGQSAINNASFTGAKQTGIPDSSNSANPGTGTPISVSTTTILDNCMSVLFARADSGTYTASTNSTEAHQGAITAIYYSTALKTPPGSVNMQATFTGGSSTWAGLMASFGPAGSNSTINFLSLMGVGT